MEENKFVKNEQGVCPVCGKAELDYIDRDECGTTITYCYECMNCHATGIEVYELRFITHEDVEEYIKDEDEEEEE